MASPGSSLAPATCHRVGGLLADGACEPALARAALEGRPGSLSQFSQVRLDQEAEGSCPSVVWPDDQEADDQEALDQEALDHEADDQEALDQEADDHDAEDQEAFELAALDQLAASNAWPPLGSVVT